MTLPPHIRDFLVPQIGGRSADELLSVLRLLTDGARTALGANLVGVYLTGSFALGCGDRASDVDFVVVASRELTRIEEQRARHLHHAIFTRKETWAKHLEGSWVSVGALCADVGAHPGWLYVGNGNSEMERSRHDDTYNARWVLQQKGKALVGPPPSEFLREVAVSDMRAEAVAQADARDAWLRRHPVTLSSAWGQPYFVLTHCRLIWTAEHGSVAGKTDAAQWVCDYVAPATHRHVITAAMRHRVQPFDTVTDRADPELAEPAAAFVRWATEEVHRRAQG